MCWWECCLLGEEHLTLGSPLSLGHTRPPISLFRKSLWFLSALASEDRASEKAALEGGGQI